MYFGDPCGIRTRDLLDENQISWTTRRRGRVALLQFTILDLELRLEIIPQQIGTELVARSAHNYALAESDFGRLRKSWCAGCRLLVYLIIVMLTNTNIEWK